MKLLSNASGTSACASARRRCPRKGAALIAGLLLVFAAPSGRLSAQTSHSSASVSDGANSNNSCTSSTGFAGSTSTASCTHVPVTPVAITGGTGSAFSTSTNATRTASASTTLAQTGPANSMNGFTQALSNQSSWISVTGSLAPTDNVVFHFLTPVMQATGAAGTSSSSAVWQFVLDAGSFSGTEYRYGYGDGTSSVTVYNSATPTAGGVDFTVPLSAFTSPGLLNYVFEPFVQGDIHLNQPTGTMLNASISATLQGVDAETAQGQYIASAMFNPDGTGTLDVTSPITTPEPSTIAMLGSGLVGLIPIIRRRRKDRV